MLMSSHASKVGKDNFCCATTVSTSRVIYSWRLLVQGRWSHLSTRECLTSLSNKSSLGNFQVASYHFNLKRGLVYDFTI